VQEHQEIEITAFARSAEETSRSGETEEEFGGKRILGARKRPEAPEAMEID
jgi:hypothetical protein